MVDPNYGLYDILLFSRVSLPVCIIPERLRNSPNPLGKLTAKDVLALAE
jgi:hypothetical protein